MSDKQRGLLFLGFGVFFSLAFLAGGGVVTSTNGVYWTVVFAGSFVMGLAIAGPWVYWSAKANRRATSTGHQQPKAAYYVGMLIFGLVLPLFLMLFSSDLFLSSPGQHGFMIGMGFCLAQFVPLGLGFLRVNAEQSGEREPPKTPVLKS